MAINKVDQLEVRDALEEYRNTFELQCDVIVEKARVLRVSYDALIDQGFTPSQSLALIKTRELTL